MMLSSRVRRTRFKSAAFALLGAIAFMTSANAAQADVVDDYQAFLNMQMAATQKFVDDEQAFLRSITGGTQRVIDDEQRLLSALLADMQQFVDDEQAFIRGAGCTGTCFNLQTVTDDYQAFLAQQQGALERFIDDEQAFIAANEPGLHQFVEDEQRFLDQQHALTQAFIDDEQAFLGGADFNTIYAVYFGGLTSTIEDSADTGDLLSSGTVGMAEVSGVLPEGVAEEELTQTCVTLSAQQRAAGGCSPKDERCYRYTVNVQSRFPGGRGLLWTADLYKDWCGTRTRLTRQAADTYHRTHSCTQEANGRVKPSTSTTSISRAHGRSEMTAVYNVQCGFYSTQQRLIAGLDFYSNGNQKAYNHTN